MFLHVDILVLVELSDNIALIKKPHPHNFSGSLDKYPRMARLLMQLIQIVLSCVIFISTVFLCVNLNSVNFQYQVIHIYTYFHINLYIYIFIYRFLVYFYIYLYIHLHIYFLSIHLHIYFTYIIYLTYLYILLLIHVITFTTHLLSIRSVLLFSLSFSPLSIPQPLFLSFSHSSTHTLLLPLSLLSLSSLLSLVPPSLSVSLTLCVFLLYFHFFCCQ